MYTKDTILLDVNSLMYYRITDIKKAIYEVEDLQAALSNTAQTQLKVGRKQKKKKKREATPQCQFFI